MQKKELEKLFKSESLVLPEVLTIAITGECNLRCSHCWVDSGPDSPVSRVAKEDVQRVIDDFAALGGSAIRLTGGEPLLHPEWLELLKLAGAAGLQVLLQTNGMLFEAEDLRALRGLRLADLDIQISFDGSRAKTHDLVRGEGAFQQALNNVRALVEHGFGGNVSFFFAEMRHNLQELPELFLLAKDLGVRSVSSGSLVMCGRAEGEEVVAPPDPEQYLALLQFYADNHKFQQLYAELGCIAALEWCGTKVARSGCQFVRTPYLTAGGVIYPCLLCHADRYSVAGVFAKGLPDALIEGVPLWSSLQQLSQQRAATIPECQECSFLQNCAGGCMGRAWGSFGDFLVVEDRCQQRQAVLNWNNKN